jgi:hypothetical protein
MEDSLKLSFEMLSEQYLSRTAKERKIAEEKQLSAINSALRLWAEKVKGGGHMADMGTSSIENDHLVTALSEAKERQGNIISVRVIDGNLSIYPSSPRQYSSLQCMRDALFPPIFLSFFGTRK